MRAAIVSAAIFMLVSSGAGQDLAPKAASQGHPIALVGGTVHPVSGPVIEDGYVLFDRGRILAVGAGAPTAGDRTQVIDVSGLHVYPGLIAAYSQLGLTEIGSVRATRDMEETGRVKPEVRAAVAVNPDSTLLPVARTNGILTAGVFPRGGAIQGRASAMRMTGWTWSDMTVLDAAGLVVAWPNPRPVHAWWMEKSDEEQMKDIEKNLAAVRGAFDEAEAYLAARAADPATPVDIRWEAMSDVFPAGNAPAKRPVFFMADSYDQIVGAVEFAKARGLDPVIVGGRDAGLCLDLLTERKVPVIVTGTFRMPKRRDSAYDESFRLPAVLEEAGVRWCLSSGQGAANERNLPYAAAMAAAHGLAPDAAIRAITLSAAEILGVGKHLGSIDAGKRATLIVTDGDPLEITTNVRMAFIDGRRIDLENKQTALYEKYREKYRQLGLLPK